MTDLDAIRETHRVGTLRGAMLLAHLDGRPGYVSRDDVLAIEKEAAAQAIARVAELEAALDRSREQIEALPNLAAEWETGLEIVNREAVLEIIARPEPKP